MSEIMQQNPDGSWSPAKPIRLPWMVRVEIAARRWWKARRR